ncbi:MAG: LCP family protein [Alicyclobacillus sp.]|nr:LCP family protein [Alicyclobacillus sp.]
MARRERRPVPLTPEQQKKRKKRRMVILSSVGAAVLLLGGGAYYGLTRSLDNNVKSKVPPVVIKKTVLDKNRINVLLIGTDTRPGESGGNTDVLILCSIDNRNKRIEMMSIPRDTKVLYPDGSYAKINESLNIGGPQLTVNLVEELLQIPVDHWALTHFGGLVDIINTLHGITVDVPEPMHYRTGDKQYGVIDLNPGVQTLDGEQALGFVRFREDPLGDIGRTERQQAFLSALVHKLLQPQNIPQLPTLVQEFKGTIDTNMNLLQVMALAAGAGHFQNYQVITETLPGSFHNPVGPGDASYWIVNPLEAQYVAKQFFYDGIRQSNPIQPESVTMNWQPPVQAPSDNGTNSTSPSDNAASAGADSGQASGGGQSETRMVVTGQSANIRSGPGTQYDIIGSVMNGQSVYVIGKSGDWDKVDMGGGRSGYIAGWLLGPAT